MNGDIAARLIESSTCVRNAVAGRIAGGRGLDREFAHPAQLIQFLIFHEGYHHGQIKLALKAVAADIPALAELHVTTWNATYNTTRGPSSATRTWQWNEIFAKESRRDFVLVLEDRDGRLIGFTWGKPE